MKETFYSFVDDPYSPLAKDGSGHLLLLPRGVLLADFHNGFVGISDVGQPFLHKEFGSFTLGS